MTVGLGRGLLLMPPSTSRVPSDDPAQRDRVERLLDEFNEPLAQEFLATTTVGRDRDDGDAVDPLRACGRDDLADQPHAVVGHRDVGHQDVRAQGFEDPLRFVGRPGGGH